MHGDSCTGRGGPIDAEPFPREFTDLLRDVGDGALEEPILRAWFRGGLSAMFRLQHRTPGRFGGDSDSLTLPILQQTYASLSPVGLRSLLTELEERGVVRRAENSELEAWSYVADSSSPTAQDVQPPQQGRSADGASAAQQRL